MIRFRHLYSILSMGHCIVDMFAGDYMVVSVSCNLGTFKWDIPKAEVNVVASSQTRVTPPAIGKFTLVISVTFEELR